MDSIKAAGGPPSVQEHLASKNASASSRVSPSLSSGDRRPAEFPLEGADLLCLSHLRWNFVFQRPQHILSRRARHGRVFYFEEPLPAEGAQASLDVTHTDDNVTVAVPRLPTGLAPEESELLQRQLLNQLIAEHGIRNFILWVYTPMALGFSRHLRPQAVVYDCMDELSAFRGASPLLREREAELFRWADVVFTGGQSLYEAKQNKHPNIHAFPSSIDVSHFRRARQPQPDPGDQAAIPHPRLGFFGVLDERLDIELLRAVASARPEWHFVMLGPVVKIDPADLPRLPNIHYLGTKNYRELPQYISGWDVALLLFARNESTRYISPTKTPEYLAAGRPVVSTSIRDVVRPYGDNGLVRIADAPEEFSSAVEAALASDADQQWLARVDEFLSTNSWDLTCRRMFALVAEAVARASSPLATGSLAGAAGQELIVNNRRSDV